MTIPHSPDTATVPAVARWAGEIRPHLEAAVAPLAEDWTDSDVQNAARGRFWASWGTAEKARS